jgi:hypothetical protein
MGHILNPRGTKTMPHRTNAKNQAKQEQEEENGKEKN